MSKVTGISVARVFDSTYVHVWRGLESKTYMANPESIRRVSRLTEQYCKPEWTSLSEHRISVHFSVR